MTIERIIELLEIEKKCVLRNASGECNRYCAGCDLLQDDTELHEMYTESIALLKAQEPRVMTLEEALGAEECWLERKDGCVTVASIALNGQDSGGYDVDSNELNTMRSYIFHSGYYGKYWRCWNIRPTDAQREVEPWQK